MAIKLIALDTDGTLLDSHGKILNSTKNAVKKALNQGIKVVICSGRPIAGLKHYMDELEIIGPDQYVVTLNGAITRTANNKIMTKDLVDINFYRPMLAFAVKHTVPFNIVDEDSKIITADHTIDPIVYIQAYENMAPLYVRTPDEIEDTVQIAKGCYVGDPDTLDHIEPLVHEKFGKDLYVVRSDDHFLELLNSKVNKGNGLKELCEKLDIKPSEAMAIGDGRNDITMFNFAGTSVAMENGSAEVKKVADYVTASNDQDGISKAFDKFVF